MFDMVTSFVFRCGSYGFHSLEWRGNCVCSRKYARLCFPFFSLLPLCPLTSLLFSSPSLLYHVEIIVGTFRVSFHFSCARDLWVFFPFENRWGSFSFPDHTDSTPQWWSLVWELCLGQWLMLRDLCTLMYWSYHPRYGKWFAWSVNVSIDELIGTSFIKWRNS